MAALGRIGFAPDRFADQLKGGRGTTSRSSRTATLLWSTAATRHSRALGCARTNRGATTGWTTALWRRSLLLVGRPHGDRRPVLVATRRWGPRPGRPGRWSGGFAHHHRWFGGGPGRRPVAGLLRRPVAGLGTQGLGRPRWSWRAGWLGDGFGHRFWCRFGGACRSGWLRHHLRFAARRRAGGWFGGACRSSWLGDDFWFAARRRAGGWFGGACRSGWLGDDFWFAAGRC